MGQYKVILNNWLKIIAVGRHHEINKLSIFFLDQQICQLADYSLYLIWHICSMSHSLQP